jgi:hypothetical protein
VTPQIITIAFGGLITLLLALVGFILNSIHGDISEQRMELPKMAVELRKYTERAADLLREEANRHEAILNVTLGGLRDALETSGLRQEKLWESHAQEHSTFRETILSHEGRISLVEGVIAKVPQKRARA